VKKNKILAIIGGMVLVISLMTGLWAIDDRYVSAEELQQVKKQIYLRLDTSDYQTLTEQYYKLKLLVEQHPNDPTLREQFERVCKEREKVKERIDTLLRQ
jgi:FtsZ-interacting cell division protein ZipA